MRSSVICVAFVAFFGLAFNPTAATAQSDAEIAFEKARTTFAEQQFATARDLLITASQTDADNPDVFLLLGKAHYQLGEVDEAITAWQQTLRLAPAQAYARRMVDVLRGKLVDIDARIRVVRELLDEGQAKMVLSDISSLRREPLSAAQLTELLLLEAEALIDVGNASAALKPLSELVIRDPTQADTAGTQLLTGKARLGSTDSINQGLGILQAVKTDFPDSGEALAADLALISFRIDQGENAVDELAAWIAANGTNREIRAAHQTMIRAVSVFLQQGAGTEPDPEAPLSEAEITALKAAEHALKSLQSSEESFQLVQQIANHIEGRLVGHGAYAAASDALKRLLNLELPPTSRIALETLLKKNEQAAASVQLNAIITALNEGDGQPETLAKWIADNGEHPRLIEARKRLVTSYLEQTRSRGIVDSDAELTDSDKAAIATAGQLLAALESSAEKSKLISELLAHLQTHYSSRGAHAAAIAAQQSILALPLPTSIRRTAVTELANTQTEIAVARLQREVSAGTVGTGPLPADLAALLKTLQTINGDFPAQPAWEMQATVSARIVDFSNRIPWPAKVTQIKATDAWALDFAIPVIVANHDSKSSKIASGVVHSIVESAATITQKSARGLAAKTQGRLLAALNEDHALWQQTATQQLILLVADDAAEFAENASAGRGHLNAVFHEQQKQIFDLAGKLIVLWPSQAASVLQTLQPFFALRTAAGYDDVVEQAYAVLEVNLPPAQKRTVRLAVAESWVNQVITEHVRLLGNGFQPPKELDAQLEKALVQCYQLQSDLEPGHEFVRSVQAIRSTVITHYRNLQYYETAAAAISVKAEPRVDWLDATAEFELASLQISRALDELATQTRQFQGRENITLTPAVKEAIAGLEKFITDRPDDALVAEAVSKILSVGKKYESYEKFDIAAQIYTGLETFASNNESLQDAPPETHTVAERAALAAATALHVKASKTLDDAIASAPDADPPIELSEEFNTAVEAYQAVITKYADGSLVSTAIGKIMEIALQHAQVGSWDVAERVYANLQGQQLPLREPGRLDLARALCQLGKVIPEHARDVLAVITLWQRAVKADDDVDSAIAMAISGPAAGGLPGGGGLGGGAAGMNEVESVTAASPQPGTAPVAGRAAADDPFAEVPAVAAAVEDEDEFRADAARTTRQHALLAAVRRKQSAMASQIAMLRDREIQHLDKTEAPNQQAQQAAEPTETPMLSEAEIQRRETILDAAYAQLQAIRKTYAESTTAGQAREEIMVIVNHWRSISQWQRSAALVKRFLEDNPTDIQLPNLRHEIARDYLAWAAGAVKPEMPKQELLDDVNERFTLARTELAGIIAAFPENQSLKHQAQWDIATSHLSQARVVAGFSSTLARGQFVRAANELLQTADLYHDHPKINELPQMLWNIASELTSRRFYNEAITVWNEMTLHYPGHQLAEQAALQIAQTYQNQLRLPLRAVESYLELNFARGGNDVALQDAIFQIASGLMNEKRWVESLHVLETFVDSFPKHGSAGQALTMIGQVHQTNEVWEDAIAAYRRVILEYDQGPWAQQSKWSIAECTINLSRWEEAQGAYREYQKAYPEDAKVAEATQRLEILKDLARFQKVVDEDGQRKAFDAQYQIAAIVRTKLSNPVKAIIEYKKVAERWPESHLADDSLFQVGMIYMELGQTENARDAFFATADRYPTSPLADDALFQVGASFESEAEALAGVTRGQAVQIAAEEAQRRAYTLSQDNRRVRREQNVEQIAKLKKQGKSAEVDKQTALQAALNVQFDQANASVVANWAAQQEEALTTAQLADRQDKINAALRKAVANFRRAATVASADKADDALLRMAQIYDQRLKDSDAAMSTWLEIVKQYSGTTVAEDASWKIAKYYETHEKYADAINAYNSFLRNYRRSPKASQAQAAIAENHEQLGNWVEAMDAYTNYINNYPQGSMATKAKEQIAWIKTYRL